MKLLYGIGHMQFDSSLHNYESFSCIQLTTAEIAQHFKTGGILILEGGNDIHPALYGEPILESYGISIYTDALEQRYYQLAKEYNAPVLGICRGHQLVAALEGGSLYQDIRTAFGVYHPETHPVALTQAAIDCGFAQLMMMAPYGDSIVNSMHHQGVATMPPTGTILAEYDGLTEAILYPRALTVQWHPEFMNHIEILNFIESYFEV